MVQYSKSNTHSGENILTINVSQDLLVCRTVGEKVPRRHFEIKRNFLCSPHKDDNSSSSMRLYYHLPYSMMAGMKNEKFNEKD